MPDQSSPKPSASDAAKSFAIPSRPSRTPLNGQNVPSWKIADNNAYNSEPERQQTSQPDEQPFQQSANWPAVPEPRSSAQPFAAPIQQTEARFPEQPDSQLAAFHKASTLEQPVLRPLPPPQPPLPSANPQWHERAQQPPVAPPTSRKTRTGRRGLYIALAIIAVVVVVGGLLSQQLLNGGNAGSAQNSALVFSGNGPYVQMPLTAQQINNIQHLAGHMKYKALASLYVSHMSLDDEIGQLIMVEYNQSSYSSDLDYMINTLHVGGVIMYEFQMTSASQTKGDIAHMQQRANIPLLISTDEEGGPYVHRLSNIYGYRMSATQIEQSGSLAVATQQGLKTSKDLAALGINEDLAPDVDVNQVNGYDMVTRTFGNTPDQVIKYAGAYLQSMQGNGTVACIKHFPGLGGALTDAHTGLPVVNSTRQQIYATDLAPFKAFIQSPNALLNPGMIMPTDVLLPAIDAKYPAELSHTFMTDILRNEFGYDGVALTDALYMKGITDTWDMYTASVMALQAGNDMLLGANGTSQTLGVINAIKQALQNGQLTKARIDESVARIIALKMQYHLMPTYIPGA
jgi:beta-N-acetylhexosaminidase